jgi:hypothetical protein
MSLDQNKRAGRGAIVQYPAPQRSASTGKCSVAAWWDLQRHQTALNVGSTTVVQRLPQPVALKIELNGIHGGLPEMQGLSAWLVHLQLPSTCGPTSQQPVELRQLRVAREKVESTARRRTAVRHTSNQLTISCCWCRLFVSPQTAAIIVKA